ncbi:MAG: hypothetical protein Q9171_001619 [Xanthocarpia ochracea]
MDVSGPITFPFMKLPIEIRYMIFGCLLVRSSTVYRNPPRTTAATSEVVSCGSGVLCKADIPDQQPGDIYERTDNHHSSSCPFIPDLDLLLVSRRFYAEAAPIFYKRNHFLLHVGILPHIHCKAQVWDLVDDTAGIHEIHLRLMRHIRLVVRVFDLNGRKGVVKESYINVRNRLERFADRMRGKHGIRVLKIRCERHGSKRSISPNDFQNVLEPLGSIYGVQRVAIGGVTLGFAVKMVNAMQVDFLAVQKEEEPYGTRMIKRPKGKRVVQRYRLQPWFHSRYTFLLEELPGRPDNLGERSIVNAKDLIATGTPLETEVLDFRWLLDEKRIRYEFGTLVVDSKYH